MITTYFLLLFALVLAAIVSELKFRDDAHFAYFMTFSYGLMPLTILIVPAGWAVIMAYLLLGYALFLSTCLFIIWKENFAHGHAQSPR